MYKADVNFTKEYLKILKEFSSFLVSYSGELPVSMNFQLNTFISSLKEQSGIALKIINKKNLNKVFSIEPNILFNFVNPLDNKRKFYVSIGGMIEFKDSVLVEQSLCMNLILEHTDTCADIPAEWKFVSINEGYNILRRFHFDYDSTNDDNKKPKFHLQYGGKFNSEYLGIDKPNIHYDLFQTIDHPRIPQQPHDLIMLLDFMFREFSLKGKTITKEKKWNELVIKSEKLWLTPYYNELINRLSSCSRTSPLHRAN